MSFVKNVVASAAAILLAVNIVSAQEQISTSNRSTTTVTATATADRVRFTAPSTVVQMRLEVYNANGEKAFDNEIRGGNVVDWLLQDGQAQRLSDGSYLCVVTTKSLSGRLGQRSARLSIENTAASLHPIDSTQLTSQQIQAVGPLEQDASLTVLNEGESQTATVIAHDGTDGQLVRGKGALSFRIGDFFSGKDVEQMRLTAHGNLGIGITNPAVRLDVDGLIRSSQGIVFPDGSVQYSASRKTFGADSLRPVQSPKIGAQGDLHTASPDTSGTGTTGKISKWSDGPNGVLNDSNITEASGAIGINGSPNPSFRLDVNGSVLFRGSNPGFNLVGLRPAGNTWVFQTVDNDGRFRLFGQDNVNPGVERLTISLSTGNVGIGATSPQQNLSVNGAMNVDQAGLNNGAFNPGITFGSFSGEGIGSKRTSGGNQFGLDFYTNTANRMTILNGGNVGIGTINPTAKLHVQSSGGIAVFGTDSTGQGVAGSSHDGFAIIGNTVNGSALYGSNGNSNTTGHAGYFNGRVSITGNLAANNLPGVEFDVPTDPFDFGSIFFVDGGNTATVKTITVDVPADGFLVFFGSVLAEPVPGTINHHSFGTLQLFDETSNTTFASSRFYAVSYYDTRTIQGVLPVSAGSRTLSLKLQCSNDSGDQLLYLSNSGSFITMFFPKRY